MLPQGSFMPQGTLRPPLTVPHLGISANPVGKVVSGGMPPAPAPPVQLVGSGGPRAAHPLVDPAAGVVRPMPSQVSYTVYYCVFHGASLLQPPFE